MDFQGVMAVWQSEELEESPTDIPTSPIMEEEIEDGSAGASVVSDDYDGWNSWDGE